jgi:hypothetical protein
MKKKETIVETFRRRMMEMGKVITLPKDSPLRELLGMTEEEEENVEPTNAEEE